MGRLGCLDTLDLFMFFQATKAGSNYKSLVCGSCYVTHLWNSDGHWANKHVKAMPLVMSRIWGHFLVAGTLCSPAWFFLTSCSSSNPSHKVPITGPRSLALADLCWVTLPPEKVIDWDRNICLESICFSVLLHPGLPMYPNIGNH